MSAVQDRSKAKRKSRRYVIPGVILFGALVVLGILLWTRAEPMAPAVSESLSQEVNVPADPALEESEAKWPISGSAQELTQHDAGALGNVAVCVSVTMEDGYSHTEVMVTPALSGDMTWELYWAHSEAGRLLDHEALYFAEHGGDEAFAVVLNDGVYMPSGADGLEIVCSGEESLSFFAAVPELMKAPESERLYSFFVLTDMHINKSLPQHGENLAQALEDIITTDSESVAVFTVGDSTDNGMPWEYEELMDIIAEAGDDLPTMYYALGNHDFYNDFAGRRNQPPDYEGNMDYDRQVELFLENTGMPASYYSVEYGGARFIVLESKSLFQAFTSEEELAWLASELAAADRDEPIFVFLHEPLMDTVSGSLYSLDAEVQDWYGQYEQLGEIRALLAQYPNAILFTGHTHWQLESMQPVLLGRGEDITFVNCASTAYLWTDEDEEAEGAQGFYVEVYEDYILLRGREFLEEKWCAVAQFLLPRTE